MSHYRCQNVEGTLKREEASFVNLATAKGAWRLSYSRTGKPVTFRDDHRMHRIEVMLAGVVVGWVLLTYETTHAKAHVDHL